MIDGKYVFLCGFFDVIANGTKLINRVVKSNEFGLHDIITEIIFVLKRKEASHLKINFVLGVCGLIEHQQRNIVKVDSSEINKMKNKNLSLNPNSNFAKTTFFSEHNMR